LQIRLLREMRRSRSKARSRGFSSIVGAIFMVLIMMVLASNYFIYTLSQNTTYNNAVSQMNQLDLDRKSESTNVLNTTYSVNADNDVNVFANVTNIGSSSIRFITVWIYVSNSTWANYNFSSLSGANVQAGATFRLNINLAVYGVRLDSAASYTCASWLITLRGNTVALKTTSLGNNIIVAQVAQGIGSIAMDFKQFSHYHPPSTNNGTNIGAPSCSYTVPKSTTIFHIVLINYDTTKKTLYLYSSSYMWAPTAHSATVKSDSWDIMNVTNNLIITSFTSQALPYMQPVDVYFGTNAASWVSGSVAPMNILLFGKLGSGADVSDYGQNIPFIALSFQ